MFKINKNAKKLDKKFLKFSKFFIFIKYSFLYFKSKNQLKIEEFIQSYNDKYLAFWVY